MKSVYSAVRTGSLNKAVCASALKGYLRTNKDLRHLQHKLIGFYNWDEKCLQRGMDWVFKLPTDVEESALVEPYLLSPTDVEESELSSDSSTSVGDSKYSSTSARCCNYSLSVLLVMDEGSARCNYSLSVLLVMDEGIIRNMYSCFAEI